MDRRTFLSTLALPALLPAWQGPLARRARLRTGLNAYSFRKELQGKALTYEDLVRKAVEWNVDGLDLTVYWFPSTSPEFLFPLRRLAYRLGVEIYSISVRTEFTQPTSEGRRKEVEGACRWIDITNALGATHIRVFGGNVPKPYTEEQAVPWVVECLLRASDYAASKGVILGLENHGGICTRAERILEIVRKVDSPWVAVNLDTGNFRSDAWKQIEMCLPDAVNIQVKTEMVGDDGKRGPQDWDRVVKMIAGAGYKGYLALEYEGAEPAPQAVPRLLAQLRRLNMEYSS
jgi:L-ribulose-5-phosphate 3-epimerase